MNKDQKKMMTDLNRLLEKQDFKSEKELQKFMEGLVGKQIPSFAPEELSVQEQAQDLVLDAYELAPAQAKKNIIKALQLDSNCIEAYEFLGTTEEPVEIAIAFLERGVSIGRQIFGGEYLEEHKGAFWGFHETRPFMRCLQHYADSLYHLGYEKACIAILEEMIELNPNDNQGVRDQLLLYLIEAGDKKKFEKYAKKYPDDNSSFALFNRALFAFTVDGESVKSNKLLLKAVKQNKFVAPKLLSKNLVMNLPARYIIGSKDEADYYVTFAYHIWQNTKGATVWLKKQVSK